MRKSRIVGRLLALAWAALILAVAVPAEAAWYRAETDRFIVYGDRREDWVRDYAVRLATFDAVLRAFHPATADRPTGHKLEVYLVEGPNGVREVAPVSFSVRGFYSPSPDGVIAVVDAKEDAGRDDILFHEYAHHFMHENFPAAYPAWFSEGWAEYFMTTEIGPQTIKVGGYNPSRSIWLFDAPWLTLPDLMTKRIGQIPEDKQAIYYPQAWLLVHYMRSDPERAEQLNKAMHAIADGENPVKAFETATGLDMAELTDRLKKYRKLPIYELSNLTAAHPPRVVMTTLPPAADDLLLARARLTMARGRTRDDGFLAEVQRKARRHPGDRLAELTLAHAEFVLGDVIAGEAIVQRRLAADPSDVETLRVAGRGQVLAGEREPAEQAARFAAARVLFGRAYRLDRNDYRILFQYAYARKTDPSFPTDNDVAALNEAFSRAPSVPDIAMFAGMTLLEKGEKARAVRMLARLANNPHGGPMAAKARALIEGRSPEEAEKAVAAELGSPSSVKPPSAPASD